MAVLSVCSLHGDRGAAQCTPEAVHSLTNGLAPWHGEHSLPGHGTETEQLLGYATGGGTH